MTPLDCIELVELATDYLEDALPARERERVDRHLDMCEGCRDYVDQLRVTIRVSGRLSERDLVPPLRVALLAALRDSGA